MAPPKPKGVLKTGSRQQKRERARRIFDCSSDDDDIESVEIVRVSKARAAKSNVSKDTYQEPEDLNVAGNEEGNTGALDNIVPHAPPYEYGIAESRARTEQNRTE